MPVAKCNLQFYNWFGKVSLSTDHLASISCDPMRILFALHSHRIGTKVPLTLKRLLQLVTLDGAVDEASPTPTQDRSRVLSDAEVALLWPSLDPSLKLLLLTGQRPGEVGAMERGGGNALRTGGMQCPSCSTQLLVRKDPEVSTPVPQCGETCLPPGGRRGPEGSINELAIERSAARVPDIAS